MQKKDLLTDCRQKKRSGDKKAPKVFCGKPQMLKHLNIKKVFHTAFKMQAKIQPLAKGFPHRVLI